MLEQFLRNWRLWEGHTGEVHKYLFPISGTPQWYRGREVEMKCFKLTIIHILPAPLGVEKLERMSGTKTFFRVLFLLIILPYFFWRKLITPSQVCFIYGSYCWIFSVLSWLTIFSLYFLPLPCWGGGIIEFVGTQKTGTTYRNNLPNCCCWGWKAPLEIISPTLWSLRLYYSLDASDPLYPRLKTPQPLRTICSSTCPSGKEKTKKKKRWVFFFSV